MKEVDLAYAAGIIDGEGWIGISKSKSWYFLMCQVGQRDPDIVFWLSRLFGGCVTNRKDARGRLVWRWTVRGEKAAGFIHLLIPYLVLKSKQAYIAIEFQESLRRYESQGKKVPSEVTTHREACKQTISALNHNREEF